MNIKVPVACLAVSASVAAILTTGVATGHVSKGDSWYFDPATTTDDGASSGYIDPMTILMEPGSPNQRKADESGVLAVLDADWQRGGRPRMKKHGCLQRASAGADVSPFHEGQGLFFRNPRKRDNSEDWETGTNPDCHNQWHMRWFDDDDPHNESEGHGDSGQWSLSGIHRERYVGVSNGGHKLTKVGGRYWDAYRSAAVSRHKGRCRLNRWRMYPGADRPFQGKDHDGYIALIQFQKKPRGRSCFGRSG